MNKRIFFFIFLILILTAACSLPPILTPVQSITQTAPAADQLLEALTIGWLLSTEPAYPADLPAGTEASLILTLEIQHCQVINSGYTNCIALDPAAAPPIQMDICFSSESPCQLTGNWQPLQASQVSSLVVDWLGERTFWVSGAFRDDNGESILAHPMYFMFDFTPRIEDSITIWGFFDSQTPIASLPEPVQTAVVFIQQQTPVTGSIELENGACCVGGTAGDTTEISAAFQAHSIYGEVTEMRIQYVSSCKAPDLETQFADASWEPFVENKTYPITIYLNWVGFYLGVQYRDSEGNLSPIYCDDISVEGSPAEPSSDP